MIDILRQCKNAVYFDCSNSTNRILDWKLMSHVGQREMRKHSPCNAIVTKLSKYQYRGHDKISWVEGDNKILTWHVFIAYHTHDVIMSVRTCRQECLCGWLHVGQA